jgi:hypothetical protein
MLTRANLTSYLASTFAPIARETATMPSDTSDGFALPIDATLRRLGTAESLLATGTVAVGLENAAYALAEYHSLLRFWRLLATRVDMPATGIMSPRSQIFRQVGDLLKAAEARCAALGYPITEKSSSYLVRIGLDYIEPGAVPHG